MDREDQRRYFVVGSVFMEIVTPLFRQKVINDYKSKGLGSIQAFINSQSVIHILFHLRHRNTHCCQDQVHCYNSPALPVNYSQWDLLYSENPGPGPHNCHCKFTANQIQLDDLDITLASLILLNCCNLGQQEENGIRQLRQYKNDYLSHNTKGQITETEYNTLWTDLESFILQLYPSKKDDLIRLEQRPLDQPLCDKYLTCLLDLHKKLDEMDTKLDHHTELLQEVLRNQTKKSLFLRGLSSLLNLLKIIQQPDEPEQPKLGQPDKSAQPKLGQPDKPEQPKLGQPDKSAQPKLGQPDEPAQPKLGQPDKPAQPKLGQSLLTLHHQTDLTSVTPGNQSVIDMTVMDDGRLVLCLYDQFILLICNTDGPQIDRIHVQGIPSFVTAVNNSTVAVKLWYSKSIEMYDINNKLKLKSIYVPGMWCGRSITTINNKLVVHGEKRLHIIDYQTGEVVQTIKTVCHSYRIHGSGDRLFYFNPYTNNNLYWYSYTDDKHHTLTLPSVPLSMTTLQDGSMYVMCKDGSIQHVSFDVKQYKPVITFQSTSFCVGIHYNLTQRKLWTIQNENKHVTVYSEI